MNAKFKQVPAELIILKCHQSVLLAARRGGSYPAVAPPAPRGDEGLQRWLPGAGRTRRRAPGGRRQPHRLPQAEPKMAASPPPTVRRWRVAPCPFRAPFFANVHEGEHENNEEAFAHALREAGSSGGTAAERGRGAAPPASAPRPFPSRRRGAHPAPQPQAEEEGEAPAPGRPPGLPQPPRARLGPTAPSPGWGPSPSPPSAWPRPPPPPVSRAPRGGAGARFRHASARPCRHRAGKAKWRENNSPGDKRHRHTVRGGCLSVSERYSRHQAFPLCLYSPHSLGALLCSFHVCF
ncbi:hypothetical protein LUU34_00053600 [Aix galericulata]|nr:hypothetical protein LUU34_00053600 [Aix galericulata]